MDQKQASEQRFALLIDAENVSAKYIKPILSELSKYGTVTYKRIYGDWTQSLHARWKDALLENSITPIQQFSYTSGKNSTDSAMIIDAMDILYTGDVEGFCLVSSDSDFTRLASRLRESGVTVIGMGERKTPKPFRTACDIFTTLEVINAHHRKVDRSGDSAAPSAEEVEQAVVDIVTDNVNNGKATGLGEVGSRLLKVYPDFDVRSFGTGLSQLLEQFSRVTVIRDGNNINVELTAPAGEAKGDGEEKKPVTSEGGRRRRARVRKTLTPKAEAEAPKDAAAAPAAAAPAGEAEKPAEKPADKEAEKPAGKETEKPAAQAAENAPEAKEEKPAARTPRRRGRRPKAAGVTPEAKADAAEEEAAKTPKPETEEKTVPAAEAKAAPAAEAPKKTGRRGRPRKNAAVAAPSDAEPAAQDKPKAEASAEAPKRRGRKPRKTGTPADEATDAKTYIKEIVKASGAEGVDLGLLNRQLRSRFRGFKIRDLGFTRINSYIESQRGMTVVTRDDQAFAVSTSALRAAKKTDSAQ